MLVYALEFYDREFSDECAYKYFTSELDALEYMDKVCSNKSLYNRLRKPTTASLLEIPYSDFLDFLNDPAGEDWYCSTHWFDIDKNFVEKI